MLLRGPPCVSTVPEGVPSLLAGCGGGSGPQKVGQLVSSSSPSLFIVSVRALVTVS